MAGLPVDAIIDLTTESVEPVAAIRNEANAEVMAQECSTLPEYDDIEMPTVQLHNVISSVYLGREMELKLMGAEILEAEYNPKRIDAVKLTLRDPETRALVYSNGTMICSGAKSEWQAQLAAHKFARMIGRYNFAVKCWDVKIEDVSGSCQLPFPIQLANLSRFRPEVISYEPEVHPALVYYMKVPNVSLVIYKNGKVFIFGGKEKQDLDKAFKIIYPVLKHFRWP